MSTSKALYIHVPFCASICAYCDFFRYRYNAARADRWLTETVSDLKKIQEPVDTVYIGGGTPSVLCEKELETLLRATERFLPVKEFTVECNPESVTVSKAACMKKYGVNRVSLGVQSFDDGMLKKLGRTHTVKTAKDAIGILRDSGISNISLDLMYSLPEQTVEDWKNTLREAVGTGVPHLSVYSLTVDEGSRFYAEGKEPLDNDTEYEMYAYAIRYLEENGYRQYEISNFAKDGFCSAHNRKYWLYEDFIGIGPGASGKEQHVRYTNRPDLKGYLEGKREREEVILSEKDERFEAVMMGLRLTEGISLDDYRERFGMDLRDVFPKTVKSNFASGRLEAAGGKIRASAEGRFILHDILVDFLEEE